MYGGMMNYNDSGLCRVGKGQYLLHRRQILSINT
jgi:hypothetical protein